MDQLTCVWSSDDASSPQGAVMAQLYTYQRDPININQFFDSARVDTSNCSFWMDPAMHMVLSD